MDELLVGLVAWWTDFAVNAKSREKEQQFLKVFAPNLPAIFSISRKSSNFV